MRDASQHEVLKRCLNDESVFKMVVKGCDEIRKGGDWDKRSKIEKYTPSPSEACKQFEEKQEELPIFCHRPPGKGYSGLHVSLQVKAFGKFIDLQETIPDPKYYSLAVKLMIAMSEFYKCETSRRHAFKQKIQEIMFADQGLLYQEEKKISHAKIDLAIVSSSGQVLVSFEFKNEFSGISSEPTAQNIACYINSQKSLHRQRAPMLLINCIGCNYLQVFGAAWNKGALCVDPLTPPVSLLHVPYDPLCGLERLAHLLAAVDATTLELMEYYSHPNNKSIGPYFSKFDDSKIVYKKTIPNKENLFVASLNNSNGCKEVVVKFSQRYGIEVHRFLADKNKAPKVIHFEKLPGKWFVVVMEKVVCKNDDAVACAHIHGELQTVLEELKSNNFVHGDLRKQNILLLADNTIKVVDFDWAGESGAVKYPTNLNIECPWHPDVTPGGPILHEHDEYQLSLWET